MAHALIPLKDLVAAKSRLSGLLRPAERRALAQAMAEDVLACLRAHPDIEGVTLVSDDPCARLLADSYGVELVAERGLPVRGLNPLIDCVSDSLMTDKLQTLLVLHADLPLLQAADIDRVLSSRARHDCLVIACDRHGTGTNLLAFGPHSRPTFHFGADSCRRHRQAAEHAGYDCKVLQLPGLALDIDEPADLALLLGQQGGLQGSATRTFFCDNGLAARLQLALASITDAPEMTLTGAEQE